jgi:hypothetical protein
MTSITYSVIIAHVVELIETGAWLRFGAPINFRLSSDRVDTILIDLINITTIEMHAGLVQALALYKSNLLQFLATRFPHGLLSADDLRVCRVPNPDTTRVIVRATQISTRPDNEPGEYRARTVVTLSFCSVTPSSTPTPPDIPSQLQLMSDAQSDKYRARLLRLAAVIRVTGSQ